MHFTLLFLVAVVLGPVSVWAQCPEECRCEDTDIGRKAKCSGLSEVSPLGDGDYVFKILDISYNDISILEDRVFSDNSLLKLMSLNISHNIIRQINVNAFLLMTDLKLLDLSNNELSQIETGTFDPLSQNLEELYLNNNPVLVLGAGFAFTRISLLDLGHCGQKSLPENFLSGMKTLIHLRLAANEMVAIDRISTEVSELNSLTSLELQGNKLTSLNTQLLLLQDDIEIDLRDNPWECDCDFLSLISVYELRSFHPMLKCSGPVEVKGRDATSSLAAERKCDSGSSTLRTSWLGVGLFLFLAMSVPAW